METLKVASAQLELIDNDFEGNMEKVRDMVGRVMTERGVDLLLFPEVCIEGVDTSDVKTAKLTDEKIAEIDGFWREMAQVSGIHILAGRTGKQNGAWQNLATCYAPDKTVLAEYSKIHLYNAEREFYQPGNARVIFDLKGWRIGIMICADLGFPELSRAMAVDGVDLFAVCSCWGEPLTMMWCLCNQMRAGENGCYLISSNRIGDEITGRKAIGNSMLVSQSGEILANLGLTDNGYFTYTIQKGDYASMLPPSSYWLDWRRPELYS